MVDEEKDNMVNLSDFKSVNIYVKSNEAIFLLGRELFEKLKVLRNGEGITGVYFTHYSPTYIHIGFRYTDWLKVEDE